jgi:cell division protein FtsB
MDFRELQASAPEERSNRWLTMILRAGQFVLLLLVVPLVLVIFRNPLDEQTAMRNKLEQLQQQEKELTLKRDLLVSRMEWIRTSTDYLEVEARDRLNMHQAGEYVLRFQD